MGHSLTEHLLQNQEGIYLSPLQARGQETEVALRRAVAQEKLPQDLLAEISVHHSVPVMDHEVRNFLAKIPKGGVILDMGGCWGWHWRNISQIRPDVRIVIIDMVEENLVKAKGFLGSLVSQQIDLVCGNGVCLPFPDESFDGYWSVQTLQHIESFEQVVTEAHRVLKPNGPFVSYSLNYQPPVAALFKLLKRPYHVQGVVGGRYYLERGSVRQESMIARIFGVKVLRRYTEVLFNPDLGLHGSGGERSVLGSLDKSISGTWFLPRLFARQVSFHASKVKRLQENHK